MTIHDNLEIKEFMCVKFFSTEFDNDGWCRHRVIKKSQLEAKFKYLNNVKTKITAYISVMNQLDNSLKVVHQTSYCF